MTGPRVLIAYSDTGGGHRSAARAIAEALGAQRDDVAIASVDVLADWSGWPFHRMPGFYPRLIAHAPWAWGTGFSLSDTPRRARWLQRAAWPLVRDGLHRLARTHPADVIVTTHPLLVAPLRRAYPDVPLVTVVTDLVSGHAWWYDAAADLVVVPTGAARTRALECGVPAGRIATLGLPVAAEALVVVEDRAQLRRALGWDASRPTVLLAGGADGMGPLEALARAIDAAPLDCDIAVVCGRNAALRSRLEARRWRSRVHVHGFVPHFPQLLRAAAAVVTKAGPGTIAEACVAGCPMILAGAIPGQETGNVRFVTEGSAGVWAPSPEAVVTALGAWLEPRDGPGALRRAATAARRLARPHAARDIAAHVLALAQRTTVVEKATPSASAAA